MRILAFLLLATLLLDPALAGAQYTPAPGDRGTRGAGPDPVQHGAQPNPQEVRPGSAEGDAPSAAAGRLVRDPDERRILGLPVTAALVVAGVVIALLVLAGIVIPNARRRQRARGGGTYGR
ncbi:MAG TPA: hypothetical protein VNN07_07520 [Candidatus Tectomicrobia bacterium]|nr:hypothetical protein [Candidatus Tectomicrobia bacterium]